MRLYQFMINRAFFIHEVRYQAWLKNVHNLKCIYSKAIKLHFGATDGYNNNHISLFYRLKQNACQMMTLYLLCWKFHFKVAKQIHFQSNPLLGIHVSRAILSLEHNVKHKEINKPKYIIMPTLQCGRQTPQALWTICFVF